MSILLPVAKNRSVKIWEISEKYGKYNVHAARQLLYAESLV